MKVLVVSVFPPDPAPEANHALHIAEHLAEAGIEVHVLCRKGGVGAERVTVHDVMLDWSWSDRPALVGCLKRVRPDVVLLLYIGWVFCHEPMVTYLPTICRRVLPSAGCITQFENVDEHVPRHPLPTRAARHVARLWAGAKRVHPHFGTLLRDSDRVVALSSPHRDRLSRHDAEVETKCVIVPPSPLIRSSEVDAAQARAGMRERMGVASDEFLWMYWGYVYPGKGIETLLHAFATAAREHSALRLALVGGSLDFPVGSSRGRDYLEGVQRLAQTLGLGERVIWTGAFSWDSDLGSRYLHAADACVLPFDYGVTLNNSSLAAATTHDLPVLATHLAQGADEAFEHGRNIYLCRPRERTLLAQAMLLIATDRELRDRLVSGARALAEKWHGWGATTGRLRSLFADVVAERQGRQEELRAQAPVRTDTLWSYVQPPVAASAGMAEEGPEPPVSIVVAVYNVEKYLSQCLDSLVNQTLPGVEIIVVNDSSTDGSLDIIRAYQARHRNIRAVNCRHNVGLATVRNIGLQLARGRYVGFADGDDWVDTRMCEVLVRRAERDAADVVIGNASVFYEDSKTFGPFFDQHVRRSLDPLLRTVPFEVRHHPRVLLVEPVAWTKIYRRAFLDTAGITFEDGMNSYEDVCFHFSVMCQAQRVSLTDEPLCYYRQSRPGQISGRRNRKVFEVFAVFERIADRLASLQVPREVWAMFVAVQVRQFDWLMKDRVLPGHKAEFFDGVQRQLALVPERGFEAYAAHASPYEAAALFCMRRGWGAPYKRLARHRWPVPTLLRALEEARRDSLFKRCAARGPRALRRKGLAACRSLTRSLVNLRPMENRLRALADMHGEMLGSEVVGREPLIEPIRIGDYLLLIATPAQRSGLGEAAWRVHSDYYLTQGAVLRAGDVVVDVGAHLGVQSIYLAKRYPDVTVYAVEPNPRLYACLLDSIALNGVSNVVPINKAVADQAGTRTLYIDPWNVGWASLDAAAAGARRIVRAAQAEVTTLDNLFEEQGIAHCRLLKLTAPGAVRAALQGLAGRARVDLLCGEVEVEDCSSVELEAQSWRVARHHFWRLASRSGQRLPQAWLHDLPRRPANHAAYSLRGEAEAIPAPTATVEARERL